MKSIIKLLITMMLTIILSASFCVSQNIVWEQTYPQIGQQNITDITMLDGEIFAVGNSSHLGNKGRIMRIDSMGNLKWSKDVLLKNLNRSEMAGIQKVKGEPNLYISGFISQSGVANYSFVAKVDSAGDTLWINTSNEQGFYNLTSSMVQLKDKSIVSAGWRTTASGRDAVAWKIDSTGQTLWKEYYTLGSTEAFDITEMMDGSLIMAGRNSGDNLLLRIGFDGRLIDTFSKSPNTGNLWANHILVNQSNELIVDSYSSPNGSNFVGELFKVDMEAKQTIWSRQFGLGINAPAIINSDSNIFVDWIPNSGSLTLSKKEYNGITSIWDFPYTNGSKSVRVIESMMFDKNDKMLVGGYLDTLSSNNYWLAKIDGVGEEWTPDPCAFSPPVAGFAYDFNGGIFTLLDTSYSGLPYLDTIYTWDWTLSDGFTSNLESPVTLLDTTTTKTLDIQLIVSNWYGCKDTINQTLNFGPTGITSDIQFEEKVWPNPARDVLNISLSERPNQNVLFEIYDVHGRKQLQTSFSGKESNLNISTLASGVYFYKLSSGGVVKRGKVVKG